MKKFVVGIIMIMLHHHSNCQIRYRFNLAGEYGSSTSNKNIGNQFGLKIAEYYQPFSEFNLFGGLSFEIIKLEKLRAPGFPLGLSIGYFGDKHAIIPIADVNVGYNVYNFSDSSKARVFSQKGKYFSSANIGIGYNKWKSTPYITVGISNFSFTQASHTVGSDIIENTKFNNKQIIIKVGFLMR